MDIIEEILSGQEKPQAIELTRGEIVTALRMRKKLTKSALAQITGLSRNYVRMIELDKAGNLCERTLFALADALDVNAWQLLKRPMATQEENTP